MRRSHFIYQHALLATAASVTLFPLFIMAITSLKPIAEIYAGNLFSLPNAPSLAAWEVAWEKACIGDRCDGLSVWFLNSVQIVLLALSGSILIGAVTGYVLSQVRRGLAKALFFSLLVALFIPPQVMLYPMIALVRALGWFGTLPGLVFVHIVWGLPFVSLVFRSFFLQISPDVINASRIDGAGPLQRFVHVIIPASLPVFVITSVLQFTFIWNDFVLGLTFGAADQKPVTVALYNLAGGKFGPQEYNVNLAATMLAALPTVLIYLLFAPILHRQPLKSMGTT